MAELENARIPDLDEITVINSNSWLVIYDVLTNVTYKIKSNLFVQTTDQNFSWVSNYSYSLDEVSTYGGFWWQSLVNGNLGNIPTEGAYWTKLSKSSAWGLWAAGVYSESTVFVLQPVDGYYQLFRLASLTRPFVSSNFNSEWAAGSWELASERGYFIINKTAHGFVANNQLTYKTGAWNKFTTGDEKLAIVRQVIDANTVVAVAQGVVLKNLTGRTPGTVYYAQSNGTISATTTADPVYVAISATEAILFGGSSGWRTKGSTNLIGNVDINANGNNIYMGSVVDVEMGEFVITKDNVGISALDGSDSGSVNVQPNSVSIGASGPLGGGILSLSDAGIFYKGSKFGQKVEHFACSDETTALTTGQKVSFRSSVEFVAISEIRISLVTAQTSGVIFTVDVRKNGVSMFTTLLTIDNGEKTSKTANTPAVLSATTIDDDDEITVHITQIGDGTAKGLKGKIIGY